MNRNLKLSDLGARIIIVTNARNLANQLNAIAERAAENANDQSAVNRASGAS